MRITFSGLERSIDCPLAFVSVFESSEPTLFAGICQSLLSGLREQAVEPYALWDDEGEKLKAGDEPIVIVNPFDLPWNNRAFLPAAYERFEHELLVDDSLRGEIESLNEAMMSYVRAMSLRFEADYAFNVEWALSKYLKTFSFGIEVRDDDKLIDKLEKFLALASDSACKRTLVFVNLKSFLSKIDLDRFYERVFLSNISVLLLEGTMDCRAFGNEIKSGIDQSFLEY